MGQKVNYNEISQVYDEVRAADVELINSFLSEVDITPATKILDIGCGTGNYTTLLQQVTHGEVYGIEPAEGMLSKARQKSSGVFFTPGQAEQIPFADTYFDFVYMTDVIHHVPDRGKMFAEIKRVLKRAGKVCIVTQSHRQIEERPIVQFFPETASVDQARYPDIDEIIPSAIGQHLTFMKRTVLYENQEIELGLDFLELVQKKGYSMLHLISDKAYHAGLRRLEIALNKGPIKSKLSGETLVWFMQDS